MEKWKVSCDIASDGAQAIEKSLKTKYDLILMDIHMPVMDGLEATQNIRTNPDNPNQMTTIIALTAVALQEEKKRAFKVGINDFVAKPFTPKVLKKMLLKSIVPTEN